MAEYNARNAQSDPLNGSNLDKRRDQINEWI